MSRMRRILPSMLAAGALLVVAPPASAIAPSEPKLVPFHARFAGAFQATIVPPQFFATGTGEGNASHLGHFSLSFSETVTLGQVVAGCATLGSTDTYTGTFTAANGDTITFQGVGTGCPTSATTVRVVDFQTVTGGTGRFEGASGSFTMITAVDRPTKTFVATLEGKLSTPGSTR